MNEVIWAGRTDSDAVADHIAAVIERNAKVSLAVPGGRTPAPILETLARRPLPWANVEISLTDDRLVPADHPASNFGLLSRSLAGTAARLMPLAEGPAPGPFDLAWIGMGADGHIASIFPSALDRLGSGRAVVRTLPNPLPREAPFERLTLTLPALADSRELILVLRGADKRAVLDAALAGENDLPIARLLSDPRGPITIFWSEA